MVEAMKYELLDEIERMTHGPREHTFLIPVE
jgi:hypothetical protein